MRYIQTAQGSSLSPKILGTYELELHSIIERIIAARPSQIIDIGAAEGYYAVGFRMRLGLDPRIVAFEMEKQGREMLMRIASLNNCESIEIREKCELPVLQSELEISSPQPGMKLIVCDTEGYEDILLDPEKLPGLQNHHILVETHDQLVPGVTDALKERFRTSHHVTEIRTRERAWLDFPKPNLWANLFPRSVALRAMSEGRGTEMSWLWMEPKASDHRNRAAN